MAENNLTIEEVSNIFKRSSKTIRRWIDEGKTFQRLLKIKGGWLIPESEVDRILEEGEIIVEKN